MWISGRSKRFSKKNQGNERNYLKMNANFAHKFLHCPGNEAGRAGNTGPFLFQLLFTLPS